MDNYNFKKLYEKWIKSLKNTNLRETTLLRHEQRYKKYFADNTVEWLEKDISAVTLSELEEWGNSLIKKFPKISRKEWSNIRTILRAVFHLALVNGYIKNNIIDDIRLTSRTLSAKKKSPNKKVFLFHEESIILKECWRDFNETGSFVPLAITFNLYMGLRVGELLAIKWSDIESNKLHIQRQYGKSIDENGKYCYKVFEYTKTARSGGKEDSSDRIIPVPDRAKMILKTIRERSKSTNEFIFYQNGKLMTSSMLNHRLYKYQRLGGITPLKSSHALRRTYASKLSFHNVNIKTIQTLLGHQNIETTYKYIFDMEERDTLLSKLNQAFENETEKGSGSKV